MLVALLGTAVGACLVAPQHGQHRPRAQPRAACCSLSLASALCLAELDASSFFDVYEAATEDASREALVVPDEFMSEGAKLYKELLVDGPISVSRSAVLDSKGITFPISEVRVTKAGWFLLGLSAWWSWSSPIGIRKYSARLRAQEDERNARGRERRSGVAGIVEPPDPAPATEPETDGEKVVQKELAETQKGAMPTGMDCDDDEECELPPSPFEEDGE